MRERNYLPLPLETKLAACRRLIESHWAVKKVCSYYHVNRKSLWRWSKLFDGSSESLGNSSHRPLSDHPRKLPVEYRYKVECLKRRNPGDSSIDIWVKTVDSGFRMSYSSCLRILKNIDGYEKYKTNPKKHNKVYHTPDYPGDKWQVDVKFVPSECKAPGLEGRYYQYTFLDEASRKRYLHFAMEHSMYETVVGLRKAIEFFGYKPTVIQTDNGSEFSDKALTRGKWAPREEGKESYLDRFCRINSIVHKFIRPRTPEHNGKVERSHRIDQEKFYRNMSFYSFGDLCVQGHRWNVKYNEMKRMVLKLRSPNEIEVEKLEKLMKDTGEVRCQKMIECLTSSDN